MNQRHAVLFVLSLLAWLVPGAEAQHVSVEPTQSAVYVGQTLTLRYTVSGTDQPPSPPTLAIDGCLVQYAGMSHRSQLYIENGRRSSSNDFDYSYSVKPQSIGVYEVPPLRFQIDANRSITSPPAKIAAARAPTSPDYRLQIESDSTEVYVGQPVTLTWTLLAARQISGADINWNAPEHADIVLEPAYDPELLRGASVAQLMGKNAALKIERRTVNNREWNAYESRLTVIPTQEGLLTIPDSSVLIDADTGQRRRGVSVFDSRTVTETLSAEAKAPVIRVRPLPENGRPADFNGLVGRYRLEATARPTDVRVGDPIELTVVIRCPDTVATEPQIDFTNVPGFADSFRIDDSTKEDARIRGGTVLKRTLRAQRDSVTAIPPIELPYFDPELGRYAIARSAPIPLEVSPTRIVTLADAKGNLDESAAGAEIESRAGGLRANVTATSALRTEQTSTLSLLKEPEIAALVIVPPLILGAATCIAFTRTRRERTTESRHARRALPEALGKLRTASSPTEIADAIRSYLSNRFPESGAAITPEELRRLLAAAGAPARELAEILEACDAARFGGIDAEPSDLATRATSSLKQLDGGTKP